MKKTDEEIWEKLTKEIEKTERAIKKYNEMSKPVTSKDAIGRVSRMNAINNKTVLATPLNNAKVKLKSLTKVLAQVGTEKFGLCLKCKKPIALGRIIARPESLLCVNCAK